MKTYQLEWIEKHRCVGTLSLADDVDPMMELNERELVGETRHQGNVTEVSNTNEYAVATMVEVDSDGNFVRRLL